MPARSVNKQKAKIVSAKAGVVDCQITLPSTTKIILANATDRAGNVEQMAHRVVLDGKSNVVKKRE